MVRFPMPSAAAVYERVTSLGNSECCLKTVFCHYGVTIVSIFVETIFAVKCVYRSVKIYTYKYVYNLCSVQCKNNRPQRQYLKLADWFSTYMT